MTAFKGLGTTGDSVGIVTPLDHKLAQSGMLVKTATPLQVRSGLFYNNTSTIVSGTAGMAYSVAAYTCATQRSAGAGVVFGGNDGALSVATTAAPGSNSRIDVIYHWHREFALDGVNSNPVIGVVQGTAAAIPTVPSLAAFPGAIELARVTVAAGATATNGAGVTVTQTAPFTALSGGVVDFRNTTERDAGSFVKGQLGWLLDTSALQVFDGTGWKSVSDGVCVALAKSANQNFTSTALMALTWDVELRDLSGMHDNVNPTRMTATVSGLYLVTASVYNNNTSGQGVIQARLSGVGDIRGSFDRRTADVAGLTLKSAFPITLNAGDYVEILVSHTTATGNIGGNTTTGAATVSMVRVGA